jgi:hypothetical protein
MKSFSFLTDDERATVYDAVDESIHNLIISLPKEVQKEVEKVPCYLDAFSTIDNHPEALGCTMTWLENAPVFIYVGAIYEAERGNLNGILGSARQVYLHELGHVLGLGEVEVRERGI